MAENFQNELIKEYKHWSVYLAPNQGYLGRVVVWANRDDANQLTDATDVEVLELISILRDVKSAVTEAFGADWFNFGFFGNMDKHAHAHVVPRYGELKTFMDTNFSDELYGKRYKTDQSFEIPDEVREGIKKKLQKLLP